MSSAASGRLLKTYGFVEKRATSYVVLVAGKKRTFSFSKHDESDEKRAKQDMTSFLEDWTRQNKVVNTYEVDDDGVARITAYESNAKTLEFTVLVDECDLPRVRDRVWFVRLKPDGVTPVYVYASGTKTNGKKRELMHCAVSGDEACEHVSGDVLDNRRANLRSASDDGDEDDSSDSSSSDGAQTSAASAAAPCLPPERDVATVDFAQYCFDNEFRIPTPVWKRFREYARQSNDNALDLATRLSAFFGTRHSSFPFPNYTENELANDASRLEEFDTSAWPNELPYSWFGQTVCKCFMIDAMFQCGYRVSEAQPVTLADTWRDDAKRVRVFLTALRLESRGLDCRALVHAVNLAYYMPSNFPPVVAKTIYDRFCGANGGARVLDLCSGWGGRFMGFWFAARPQHYVGIDPNKRVQLRYKALCFWLKQRFPNASKTYAFHQCGAETEETQRILAREPAFDVMLTSPPYFDREMYDVHDEAQSCNRFSRSYECWRDGFLHVALANGARAIKDDGFMILNVADTVRCPQLVQDVIEYMTTAMQWRLVERLQLTMPRRPGRAQRADAFEPILVFRR